ncbi:186_t:CDS:1, partial [Funneliformis caledonium]
FSKERAAGMFDIQTKQIKYWENHKEELSSASHIQKLHLGKAAALLELENLLFEWVQNL